jgi:hypothetical protein
MPGYTSDLYNYIVGLDPTFKNDVSLEQFKSKMSDTGYSKKMYDWVGQSDKTFHSDVSFDAFREKLGYKKKGPTVLPSVQKPAPISSGIQPKVTQKPSGTSVSQKNKQIEVFTNFPTKEENEYRIVNNNWQRKEPGKEWSTVRDSNAIIGLNKQYKKNIVPNEGFEGISSKLIDNSEETVVPYLQKNYGNLGFKFEETGAGDRVRVVTEDGKNSEIFTLDNWTDEGDSSEAVRLKAWLKENTNTIQRERYSKIDSEISSIKNAKPKEKADLTKDAFANMSAGIPDDLSLDIKSQLKLKEKEKEAMQYNKSRMNALMDDISKAKKTEGKIDDAEARARVAAIYGNKDEIAKQNRYINNSLNDIARVSTATNQRSKEYDQDVVKWQADLEQNNGVETPELAERKKALEGRAEMLNKEVSDLDQNLKLSKAYQSQLDDIAGEYMLFKESKGSTGGAMVNNFVKGATNILRFAGLERSSQEELIKAIGSDYTTKEYATSKDRSDIEKVLFSLSNSIGAAVGGGGVAAPVSFFAQSYYDVKDEMDDNPDFNGVPELEKTLVAGTIGVAVGFLEKFGLDRLMSKTPIGKNIVNRILLRSVKDLPKKATAEMLEESINSNMKRLLAKGALNVAGGMIVEGSTEFAQELAEGGVKELYNEMKGKEMFQSPESLLAQSFEAAYLGAMGGAVMQAPVQAANVIATGLSNKNKLLAEVLEKSVTDSELKSMMTSKIKTQILNGEITKEEGQKQLDAVNEAAVTFDKLPDNITEESRSKSFDLLIEKSKIEKEIAGKDENLVSAQKARIADINNELKTISENATKESNIEEVTAEGGGLQREGVNEGQPQVGEGEGPVGETTQQGTDLGNRPVEGRGVQEEGVETIDVYHGGSMDEKTGDIYVTEDKNQATEYAKGNQGNVIKYTIPKNAVASEQDVTNAISELGIEVNDESRLYELIDPRFEETYIGDDNKQKLFDSLKNKGFEAASFIDEDLSLNEKQGVKNIVVFEAEKLSPSSVTVTENEAENLYDQGYRPVIDGQIQVDYNKENIGDLFEKSDRAEMSLPTEPTVTEEVTTEEAVTPVSQSQNEVTIDNAQDVISKFSQDERQYKASEAARKVLKALPKAKIFLHNNANEYQNAIAFGYGQTLEQVAKDEEGVNRSSGTILPNGEIHIDMSVANSATVFHEAFHSALSQLGVKSEAMNTMVSGLSKIVKDKALIDRINKFSKKYEFAEQSEEFLAELGGIISDGQAELLSPNNIQKFKNLINNIARKIGLPAIFSEAAGRQEVLDFINSLSTNIKGGKEIQLGKNETGITEEINPSAPNTGKDVDTSSLENRKKSLIQDLGLVRQKEITQRLKTGVKLSDLGKVISHLTFSDRLVTGKVGDKDYLGGILFAAATNRVWASFSKGRVSSIINGMPVNEDGYRYLMPALLTEESHMSNKDMMNTSLKLVEDAVLNGDIDPKSANDRINKALKRKGLEKYLNIYNSSIGKNLTAESVKNAIDEAIVNSDSTFDNRKTFLEALLGKADIDLTKRFGKLPSFSELANGLAEPITEGHEYGDILLVIRTKGNLVAVQPKEGDADYHPSYPWVIRSVDENGDISDVETLIFDKSYNAINVFPKVTNKSGKTLTYQDYVDKYGDKAKSSYLGYIGGRSTMSTSLTEEVTIEAEQKEKVSEVSGKRKKQLSPEANEALNKAKEKYDISIDRGNSETQAKQSAIADLKKNDWYVNTDDTQREDAVRSLKQFFGEKIKKAPSVAKIMGQPKAETVTMTKKKLRDEFIKARNSAAIEGRNDLKSKQRAIISAINQMKRGGIFSSKQASSLAKRIVYLNVDNPVMVDRFINYAERLFERADYQEVLKNAFGLRNKIRKAGKSKDKLQAEVAGMAKKFARIDPSLVEDIDMYMEMAEKVYNAVRPVRLIKTGLVTKIAADIAQISEYQTEEIKRQEEILKNEAMDMHKYLVDSGAITSEMSLKEIKDVITILENDPEADVTDRESIIRDYVKKAFDVYSGIIIDMVKTGVDPMTGEEISFDEKQKDIIKRLIGIDTDFMKLEDAYKSIEALDNFIVNKITSGVEAIVNSYEGKLNAEAMERSGIKTRSLKLFFSGLGGRFFAEYFASLPVLIDTMFAGINAGQRFMNLSGLNEFANGVAKATREQNNMINEYGQKFEKSRPNGMDFRAAENVYERGIIAYLSRTIDGNTTQQREELGRRINIVKDSIEALSKGDKDQRKMSEIYQSLYNKLGLDEFNKNNDNLTISDIQSRADKTNLEATNWWIGKWAEKYSDLADVSLSVYNTELGSDINYTPDRYSKVEGEESPIEDVNLQKAGAFGMDLNFTDKNKTGVLMETTRPRKTPGRYVNLDFDISNARSMKAALVDINTAASVRKIDGFLRSPSMNKIIEDTKDKQILQRRINSYIRRSKHKAVINDATLRELDSAFNYVASIGAVKALGGIFQPIKQTMPVMVNTIINAGPQNMSLASVLGDSDMHEWINNSGMAIANRGMEASTTVETANKYLDKVAGSKGEALGKGLMKINEFWLKKFLQQPDVWIARSSFISYYKQALRRKGVDVSKIDWKNHPVDKEAANYAQHMVDRQQNVSDAAMMGEIMASESGTWKIARKTLLPFANFIMNQKSRMYSDFRTAASSEASKEDKVAALRSLSGLTIELAAYQYIGYSIGVMIKSLAANLVGYEPDDEEEEKNKKYAVQNASNQYIKDVLSPLPLTDGATLKAFDFIADQIQDLMISDQEIKDAIDEENKVREEMGDDPMTDKQKEKLKKDLINNRKYKFEDYKNDKLFNLGTLSIALDKSSELWEMTKMAKTGKFTEESYGAEKTKYINKADQKMMAYLSALKFASLSGALPVEANNLAMYSTKYIKKKAMTENQKDMSTELMKEMNIKELKDYQVALIEKKKSVDSVIEEVDWVESNGGLKNKKQQEEYIKILNKNGEVTSEDLDKIQKLK